MYYKQLVCFAQWCCCFAKCTPCYMKNNWNILLYYIDIIQYWCPSWRLQSCVCTGTGASSLACPPVVCCACDVFCRLMRDWEGLSSQLRSCGLLEDICRNITLFQLVPSKSLGGFVYSFWVCWPGCPSNYNWLWLLSCLFLSLYRYVMLNQWHAQSSSIV